MVDPETHSVEDPETVQVTPTTLRGWCRTSRGMTWKDDFNACDLQDGESVVQIERQDEGEDKITIGHGGGQVGTVHTQAPLSEAVINEHGTLVVGGGKTDVLGGETADFYESFGFDKEW